MQRASNQEHIVGKIDGRFPDFFIVGAPKCGTTSLHAWLRDHQALHMPEKEPGFFSQEILPLGKTLPGYLDLFAGAREGQLIGEASPKHLYSSLGLRQIRRFNPDARIIVALRPPVDLVVSFHGQMLKQGVDNVRSLEEAWRIVEQRRAGQHIPRMCPSPAMLDYPSWGLIGTRVEDVLKVFHPEQVLVVLLEDIRDKPAETYARVLQHLRVDSDGRRQFPVLNQRREIRSMAVHRTAVLLRRMSEPLLTHVYALRGGQGTGLLRAVWRINERTDKSASALSPAFSAELDAFFAPEIDRLEALLSRDLSHWRLSRRPQQKDAST